MRLKYLLFPCCLPLVLAACTESDSGYYTDLERALRNQGLMCTETAPLDAPFTARDLVTNFERVALYTEYANEGDRFVVRRTPTILSKWEGPVRIQAVFGESVPLPQRRTDIIDLSRFVARLAWLSGLDMRVLPPDAEEEANFFVFYVDRTERGQIAGMIEGMDGMGSSAVVDSLRNSPRSEICYVNTFYAPESHGEITFALTIIKSETEGLMRLSCVHEELTQALGLGNDDDRVRPSIFNDDEEFALLTRHDELLLRMLYDPELAPGMGVDEVRPLLPALAAAALEAEAQSMGN